MKFASSYEPGEYESDIYAAWEASGIFEPTTTTKPVDDNADGIDDREEANARQNVSLASSTFSIVMPPPNANGNLHIGHGLTVALEDSLTRYYRLRGASSWYIPGADHAGFETWVVYERELEKSGHTRFEYSRDELYTNVWDFVANQRGNMELQLDRKLSNRRIYPAVDVTASSTRREDLLVNPDLVNRLWVMREFLADMNSVEAMEFIRTRLPQTQSNEEFLLTMDKGL